MTNYYEYAPETFKWLATYNIKPWEIFSYLFWGSLTLGVIFILVGGFLKWKRWPIKMICFICAFFLLFYGTRLDKAYLDYESNKACSEPGIYIKRQVEANGYLDLQTFGSVDFTIEELKALKAIPPYGENIWIEKEEQYCERVTRSRGYQFYERVSINRNYDDKTTLEYWRKTENLNLDNQERKHKYSTKYIGLKEGKCHQAYLSKPTARYYIIESNRIRVGLGLFRNKTSIIDSQTGEEIAYANRYTLSTNALYKLLAGGFGSTDSYCGNSTIKTEPDVEIKEYRKASQMERNTFVMERFTLIPTQYYHQSKNSLEEQ